MIYVVSLSGGKDSVATLAWAKRTGLAPLRAVAADTKWEAALWSLYIHMVAYILDVPLTVVSGEGFEARTRRTKHFPSRAHRWCTGELKIQPIGAELDRIREETGDEVTILVGIRAEESNGKGDHTDRALWPEREWSDEFDCEVWRPILGWTLAEVIAEHARAGVPLNPLYHLGAERVGCFPCIYGGKQEIRLVADHEPARIDRIREMEHETGVTMFAKNRRAEKKREGGIGPSVQPMPIDEAVAWSRTKRGGKHLALLPEPGGCLRWGLCEGVKRKDDDE